MRYREKASTIEAIQWTGDNLEEICAFSSFIKSFQLRTNGELTISGLTFEWVLFPGWYLVKSGWSGLSVITDTEFESRFEVV